MLGRTGETGADGRGQRVFGSGGSKGLKGLKGAANVLGSSRRAARESSSWLFAIYPKRLEARGRMEGVERRRGGERVES